MNVETSSLNRPATREGTAVERASMVPPAVFLVAAGAAMIGSGALQFLAIRRVRKLRSAPLFLIGRRVELLAPVLLILGLYSKLGRRSAV